MDFDLEDELAAAAGRADDAGGLDGSDAELSDSEGEGDDADEEDSDRGRGKRPGKKGGAVPLKKRKVSGGGSRKRAASESEEEGEVQETDSEDDDDDDDEDLYGDGYGEDLYKDEEDRRRLAAMTELDREMILADRAEQRDKLKERRLNAAQAQKAAGSKSAKDKSRPTREESRRSLRDEDIEAMYVRSSTRQRGKSAQDSALQALQKTRERRAARLGTREEKAKEKLPKEKDREAKKWGSDEDEMPSEDGSEGTEEEEDDRGEQSDDDDRRGYVEEDEEGEDATFEDAMSVQLRRDRLEQWVNEVFFEEVVENCIVRVSVGEQNGETQYLAAQIKGIVDRHRDDGTPALYEISKGSVRTNKFVEIQRGNSTKVFPMSQISNRHMFREEFDNWQRFCQRSNAASLTRGDVNRCREQIKKAESFKYTVEDVKKVVEQKRKQGQARINIVVEKGKLKDLIYDAQSSGSYEKMQDLQRELDELVKHEQKVEEQRKQKNKADLASLNNRSKLANFQELQTAGQTEAKVAREMGWRATESDAFSRRKTRPMTYWKTKAGEEERAKAESVSALTDALEGGTPADNEEEKRRRAIEMEEALEDLRKMPLEVDIGRLKAPTQEGLLSKRLLGRNWQESVAPYSDESIIDNQSKWTLSSYKQLIT